MWTIVILGITVCLVCCLFRWHRSILKKLYSKTVVVEPLKKEELSQNTGVQVYVEQSQLPVLVYKQQESYEDKKNSINILFNIFYFVIILVSSASLVLVNMQYFIPPSTKELQREIIKINQEKENYQLKVKQAQEMQEDAQENLKKLNEKIEEMNKKISSPDI